MTDITPMGTICLNGSQRLLIIVAHIVVIGRRCKKCTSCEHRWILLDDDLGGVDSSTVALYDDDRYSSYNIIVT